MATIRLELTVVLVVLGNLQLREEDFCVAGELESGCCHEFAQYLRTSSTHQVLFGRERDRTNFLQGFRGSALQPSGALLAQGDQQNTTTCENFVGLPAAADKGS